MFRSNPTSEQELYQRASAKLTNAADASDLNRRGEEKTRRMLTTLARSLGFTQVTVTFDAPSTSDTTRVASVDS